MIIFYNLEMFKYQRIHVINVIKDILKHILLGLL
jgi:hypothetical protein